MSDPAIHTEADRVERRDDRVYFEAEARAALLEGDQHPGDIGFYLKGIALAALAVAAAVAASAAD